MGSGRLSRRGQRGTGWPHCQSAGDGGWLLGFVRFSETHLDRFRRLSRRSGRRGTPAGPVPSARLHTAPLSLGRGAVRRELGQGGLSRETATVPALLSLTTCAGPRPRPRGKPAPPALPVWMRLCRSSWLGLANAFSHVSHLNTLGFWELKEGPAWCVCMCSCQRHPPAQRTGASGLKSCRGLSGTEDNGAGAGLATLHGASRSASRAPLPQWQGRCLRPPAMGDLDGCQADGRLCCRPSLNETRLLILLSDQGRGPGEAACLFHPTMTRTCPTGFVATGCDLATRLKPCAASVLTPCPGQGWGYGSSRAQPAETGTLPLPPYSSSLFFIVLISHVSTSEGPRVFTSPCGL